MVQGQGTWYGVRDTHNFSGDPVAQPAPTKFGTKVVIVTYCRSGEEQSHKSPTPGGAVVLMSTVGLSVYSRLS